MKNTVVLQFVAIFLAVVALVISFGLYKKHVTGTGFSLIEAGCGGDGGGSKADCDEVLKSPFGYWPPKRADGPTDSRHVPVALLGVAYYGALALWLIGVGRPSYEKRWIHALPLLMNALGLAFSVWFAFLMFGGALENWCPWCAITHVLNLLIFLCLILLFPRAAAEAGLPQPPARAAVESDEGAELPPAAAGSHIAEGALLAANPSARQVVVTVLAMMVLSMGLNWLNLGVEKSIKASNLDRCLATLNEYKEDTKRLVSLYDTSEKKEITLRTDDPMRGGHEGEKGLLCVVFSDFECPHCDKQAFFLEEKVQPLFDGNLKIVFKHFPLSTDCNAIIKTTMHKHACKAAGMAEAARMQGGPVAFWKAHDYLFHNRKDLGGLTIEAFAEAMALDAARLRTDAASEVVAKRIWEDINLAQTVGVRATPALYLSGKEISGLARMNIEFWDEMARRYWLLRGTPRPEHTKLKKNDKPQSKAGGAGHAGP